MGFGAALMKGRGGAAGYLRQMEGKRELSARGLPAGAFCRLYAVMENGVQTCGGETAGGSGCARWEAPAAGRLFVAEGRRVLLWEGGDEIFLRACAYLEDMNRPARERQAPPQERGKEAEFSNPADSGKEALGSESGKEAVSSYPWMEKAAEGPQKESPPKRAYSLRPAGRGEPVDALPEREEGK